MFDNLFNPSKKPSEDQPFAEGQVRGRITKLDADGGWGFISSKAVPFTRIFFHWTSLVQDTLKFPSLQVGMLVDFIPQETPDGKGTRAIKVRVSEDRD